MNQLSRPNNNKREDDWIDVLSSEYRNWMETPLGPNRRLLVGRVPNGLPHGNYVIKFDQNGTISEGLFYW